MKKVSCSLLFLILLLSVITNVLAQATKTDPEFEKFWKEFQITINNRDQASFDKILEPKIYNIFTMMDDDLDFRDKSKVFTEKVMQQIFKLSKEIKNIPASKIISNELDGNHEFQRILNKKFKNKTVYRVSAGTNDEGFDMWFVKNKNEFKIIAICYQ